MKKEILVLTSVNSSSQSRLTIKWASQNRPSVQGLPSRTETRPPIIAPIGKQVLSKNGTMEKILRRQVAKHTRHTVVEAGVAPLEWYRPAVTPTEEKFNEHQRQRNESIM